MLLKLALFATTAVAVLSASHVSLPTAPSPVDSVIVRVRSATARELRVSGSVIAGNAAYSRGIAETVTPVELRLPTTSVHAVFRSIDGGELAGEIFLLRDGRRVPHAAGNTGSVMMLYVGPNGEAGFTGLR